MPDDSTPTNSTPTSSPQTTEATDRTGPPQSPLTAEQLLSRMLELISTRRRMSDFDVRTVGSALAPQVVDQTGRTLRQVARVTPHWRHVVLFDPDEPIGPVLQLQFFDHQGGTDAPMTEIAQLDLDQFSARMRAAGFAEQEIPGELGESRGRDFTAGELRVTVTSTGEADNPPDKVTHRCVLSVTVR